MFIVIVIAESVPYIGVLLMNGVFLVHIICVNVRVIRQGVSHHKLVFCLVLVALLFAVAGVTLTTVFEVRKGITELINSEFNTIFYPCDVYSLIHLTNILKHTSKIIQNTIGQDESGHL